MHRLPHLIGQHASGFGGWRVENQLLVRPHSFLRKAAKRAVDRAWVEGSGLLKLPLPAGRDIPGLDAAASRDLVVRWDESMSYVFITIIVFSALNKADVIS